MPDSGSGEAVQQQPEQNTPNGQMVNPPSPPDHPQSVVAQPVTKQEEQRDIQRIEDRVGRAERWMIGLTAVIAFFALCSVGVAFLQWRSSEAAGVDARRLADAAKTQSEAASDMSDAAWNQVEAADNFADTSDEVNRKIGDAVSQLKSAADNAKHGLDATQQAMRLDQRAWLVLKGIGPSPELDKPWSLKVIFDNPGKTPAKKVALTCGVQVAADEVGINWKHPPTYHEVILIAPNDPHYCTLQPMTVPKVTQAVLDDLSKPGVRLYVVGTAVYQDIFEKWHWLTFCRWMHPDGKEWDSCTNGGDTGDGKIPPPPFDALAN
jgi:hypothetical protein